MKSLFIIAVVTSIYPHVAFADCPPVIPLPSTEADVRCYTIDKPVNQRCATAINSTVCNFLNSTALNEGLLTQGAFAYLGQIKFCAMVNNFGDGNRIYDFCPEGCFAADTRMATGLSLEGELSYTPAASVMPQSRLVSMSEGATLSEVSLSSQRIKRTVVGPETSPLYVFSLANGMKLKVTEHHPMVLSDGKIIAASKVDTQMSFVGFDGAVVSIKEITREKTQKDVFNFETSGDSQLGHIIVAEGVLVGDLKLQNELSNEESAIGLRR